MKIFGSKRLDLIVLCYVRAQQFLIVKLYVYYLVEILRQARNTWSGTESLLTVWVHLNLGSVE